LAEKPRQLEISWETWLPNGLVPLDPSFWRLQRPEGPGKQENEDSTGKILYFSIKNFLSGHFLAEKTRRSEIC